MAADPWTEQAGRLVIRPQADRNRVGRQMMALGLVACAAVGALAWWKFPTMLFLAATPGFIVLYGAAMAFSGRAVVVDGRRRVVQVPGRPPLAFGDVDLVVLGERIQRWRTREGGHEIRWFRLAVQPRGADPLPLLELVDRERVRRAGEKVAALVERPLTQES